MMDGSSIEGGAPTQELEEVSLEPAPVEARECKRGDFLESLGAAESERLLALGVSLLRESSDARESIAKLQAQKQTLEETIGSLQAKVSALIQRRDELKRDLRVRMEESAAQQQEIVALREGMSGLAFAHGRLVANYNDQLRNNRTQQVRLGELRARLTELTGGNQPVGDESAVVPASLLDTSFVTRPLVISALRTLPKGAASTEKFVSTRFGFIYFAVPKAASQGVIRALWELHPGGIGAFVSTLSLQELFSRHPAYWHYLKFGVVRHPFSRIVSCYIDKVLDADAAKLNLFARVGEGRLPGSFEEFVGFLCQAKNQDDNSDRHWISQSSLLTDVEGNLLVDHVARCESLDADLGVILGRLGLKSPNVMPVNTRTEHIRFASAGDGELSSLDDTHYHSPELEARLRERYRRDYDIFGYGDYPASLR